VRLSVVWRKFDSRPQQLLSFFKRTLLPSDHTQMDPGGSKIRLQPKRLGKFCSRFFKLRILCQQGSEFIAQIRPCRTKLHGLAKLADRTGQILPKAQHSSQHAMGFGIIGRELHRSTSFDERAFHVLLGRERVGKVDMCLHEIRLQLDRHSQLRDGFVELAGC